jgi:hypothetical protein
MKMKCVKQTEEKVLWFVTPCSVVAGYQRFGGPRCLYLQGEVSSRGLLGCDAVYSVVVGYQRRRSMLPSHSL